MSARLTVVAALALVAGVGCGVPQGDVATRTSSTSLSAPTTTTTYCPRVSQGSLLKATALNITDGAALLGRGELSASTSGISIYTWDDGDGGFGSITYDTSGTGLGGYGPDNSYATSHAQVGLAACGW